MKILKIMPFTPPTKPELKFLENSKIISKALDFIMNTLIINVIINDIVYITQVYKSVVVKIVSGSFRLRLLCVRFRKFKQSQGKRVCGVGPVLLDHL